MTHLTEKQLKHLCECGDCQEKYGEMLEEGGY